MRQTLYHNLNVWGSFSSIVCIFSKFVQNLEVANSKDFRSGVIEPVETTTNKFQLRMYIVFFSPCITATW